MSYSLHQIPSLCAFLLSKIPLNTNLFENEQVGQGISRTSTFILRNFTVSIKFLSNLIAKAPMKVLQLLKAQAKAKEITEYYTDSVQSRITRTGKSNILLTEWTMYCFEFCLGNTKHSATGEKQAVNKIVHLQTLTSCIFSLFQLFFFKCVWIYIHLWTQERFSYSDCSITQFLTYLARYNILLIKNHSQTFFCGFYTNADVYPTFTRQFKIQNTLKSMYMNLTTQSYVFNIVSIWLPFSV